ncbi:uncharacterized protein si:ch211-256m1.8 [Hypomesus transpacificus]|uniref:uncharacterized protein si:ch211-256m1.8 n=1 Tax=Hypomesus transpacificus TaxID=137520 RepID=UPI001F08126E|nr:uncharacterized protein si:ch211-256m1.8 [Hypomesus transpacificus]
MALLDYPVPELDVTLQEASRVLQLTLEPELYPQYISTLSQQRGVLEEAQTRLAAAASGRENWVTEQFKSRLLSCTDPLPTSTAIPSVLPPSQVERSQAERAAALMWAVAKLYTEPSLVEGDVPTERTQQSEVFATSRIPGSTQDQIQVYPESLHAIIISSGGVFSVNILERSVPGGPMSPLPFLHIYSQVLQVLNQPPAAEENDPRAICSLSALQRQAWSSVRGDILRRGGPTAASLGVMESALVALSLEDCNPPSDLADTLNAVRLGGGDGSCLRYYDKVVNLVVFKDSTAGMVFEHSALDGMVAGLVAESVFYLSESVSLDLTQANIVSSDGSTIANMDSPTPGPLSFPMQGITNPSPSPPLKATHPVLTFEVSSYADVFSTLQGHRGLYDAWINFSLQLSLRQTLGDSADTHILVTPTHMRHYKHGRCDPTYSLTMKSRQLVGALATCVGPDNIPRYTTDLLRLFHAAFLEHKNLIKATKSGHGVGPHLAALRWALSPDNPLKRFLESFGCPSVYLTGKDVMEGVECAVGNVYAKDQLAVTYLGRSDRVRMVLNGKGSFATILERLQDSLKVTLKLVMLLAVRYALAGQMGALECLLQEGQAGQMNDLVEGKISPSCVPVGPRLGRKVSKQTLTSDQATADLKQDFTLVIHGGAGEVMMLNQKVVGVIEFALQTALTLGARVLQGGGSSLDAVQTSVAALEDCFLFNAGKGSVFNQEGKNEMEATIVDGSGMTSGSVACLQRVKNPINAARHVMDKSAHSLLVGEGAEEFVQSLEGSAKPVSAQYFHTDVRRRELITKLSAGNASKNNHPQTVGAVALDRQGKLAAATSTGGLVGKWKGRVGDTAVVGAGIYADDQLAVTCSGDGDVFLSHTVAQKVAGLYHHKGSNLRQACRELMTENLKGNCAGIIAVDARGDAVIETNAGVMFVASIISGITRVEVIRPMKSSCNVIWETDNLVAYLHSSPWTPGATILTRKTLSGQNSIFKLPLPDFLEMLRGAKAVASLLCDRMEVQRCALVCQPQPDQPAQIRVLPLHSLEAEWKPHLASEEDFQVYDPGYCSSKSGPRWEDHDLDQVQAKIQNKLPTPNAPPSYDYLGEPSDDSLFSRIVRGEEQQWRVWEDNDHVAFLTPYPNTPGLTVLVPRKPLTSDIFRLKDSDYTSLILAARKVAGLLVEGLRARGVALIFEGFEIDYAHVKLIPLVPSPSSEPPALQQECVTAYPGYVSSADGPPASPETLREIYTRISLCRPPRSWEDPQTHSALAIRSQWYRNLFQIQNTLFHSTVEYFHNTCQYSYALTPLTTDTISSPMGLGSDSEPVFVNMLGQGVYLADSMQFVLEYFLRFQENLPGTYYVSPSFRGEDPDATHLNQFYHVECELLGNMDDAMNIAEGYVANLTKAMLKKHSDIILNTAGTLSHAQDMLEKLDGRTPLPRVTLDQAIPMMPSADCLEWVQDGQPQFGRKLTRKGERVLIKKYGGAVWLTEMDHLGVPFYQAYVEHSGKRKAKAADLLLGLGETVGLGERHSTPEMVQDALRHHLVPEESYRWYINMRQVIPLLTSGWGMGTERYLCWLLQHDDIRDIHIIPRMKARKYMP